MNTHPKVIFQDSYILIIDKPAQMIVNRADTTRKTFTLQDWVDEELKIKRGELRVSEDTDFKSRSGIVHRLDKETSGLIIIAKDEESFVNLQRQFKEGSVKKSYIALVHGKVIPESSEISVPIGRLPWNRMRFGVLPAGRESKTLYKVKEYKTIKFDNKEEILSLVDVYPKTGRTHQIRVHFQYIKHPIFADELYAGRKNSKNDRKLLSRHFLHASSISFTHPVTHIPVSFSSPLPVELVDFLKILE